MRTKAIHIALGEAEFRKLVRGEIVEIHASPMTVKLILSDIGFDRMEAALDDAQSRGLAKPEHDQT